MMSFLLDILLVATPALHVLLSPYTKVEESFNLHAIHDVIFYGIHPNSLRHFDHFIFPGPVTRTFIPSIFLAWISHPIARILQLFGFTNSKFDVQVIVRLTLATINAFGLCVLRRAVSRRFGRLTSVYFTLLACTQFHVPFWMGRTIPNMFAFFLVNLALSNLIGRAPSVARPSEERVSNAMILLIFAAVIIRAEVAVLAALIILQALIAGDVSFWTMLDVGLMHSFLAISCTMVVDSYIWQRKFLWPEFESIFFNIWQGKSAEWGTSPFGTYFIAYLPKLLLASLPLSVLGTAVDSRIRSMMGPAVLYVLAMSFLGHKEWRFIVYVVPIFNIAAALGARWMTTVRQGTFIGRLLTLAVYCLLGLNLVITALFTKSSMHNYPGGEALSTFNLIFGNTFGVHVHISNLAAQTGASLFLQTHAEPFWERDPNPKDWVYDKTENLPASMLDENEFVTHLIAESPSAHDNWRWDTIEPISSFSSWTFDKSLLDLNLLNSDKEELLQRAQDALKMVQEERLIILERVR